MGFHGLLKWSKKMCVEQMRISKNENYQERPNYTLDVPSWCVMLSFLAKCGIDDLGLHERFNEMVVMMNREGLLRFETYWILPWIMDIFQRTVVFLWSGCDGLGGSVRTFALLVTVDKTHFFTLISNMHSFYLYFPLYWDMIPGLTNRVSIL